LELKRYLTLALRPSIVKRGLVFSVVVGTILVLINHGDAIFAGALTTVQMLKMALTYVVPYVVSSLSSIQSIIANEEPGDK